MRSMFLFLLVALLVVFKVQGQSVRANLHFKSSASMLYLSSDPAIYLGQPSVRFYTAKSPFLLYAKSKMPWELDSSDLMSNRYPFLDTDVKFNYGVPVDLRSYVNSLEESKAKNENRRPHYPYPTKWRKDLTVLGNIAHILWFE